MAEFLLPRWSCLNCLLPPSPGWLIDGSAWRLRKCPRGKKGGQDDNPHVEQAANWRGASGSGR